MTGPVGDDPAAHLEATFGPLMDRLAHVQPVLPWSHRTRVLRILTPQQGWSRSPARDYDAGPTMTSRHSGPYSRNIGTSESS
jgi:hypothetical protein